MTKQKVSTGYLDKLWRKAALIIHNHKCALCGRLGDQNLQIHHIVRRRNAFLKHHYKNGIALCHECHLFCHTKKGEIWLSESVADYEWLCEKENVILKQYLVDNGITRSEFSLIRKNELKDIIND